MWHKKGSDNQKWKFEDGFFVSKASGLVLDVKGGDHREGAEIIVWTQKSGNAAANQLWKITKKGHIKSKLNKGNKLVLDIKGADPNPGASLIVWHKK